MGFLPTGPMSDCSNASVRYPIPFLTFWCGTEGENAPDLDLISLCWWPSTGSGSCKPCGCHCSVLIFHLPKARSGQWLRSTTILYFAANAGSRNWKKKKVSGVCFEDVVYRKVFSSWHFTIAQMENVNVKICIFSMDHQAYLKMKSINLPATEILLVRFFPCIPLARLWKAERAPSTVTEHTTNAISDFLEGKIFQNVTSDSKKDSSTWARSIMDITEENNLILTTAITKSLDYISNNFQSSLLLPVSPKCYL